MSKKTVALAATLLVGSIGAASAQGQTQSREAGQAPAAVPYSQQVPDTAPLAPHIHKPEVNPNAAGTMREGDKKPSYPKTGEESREHSGSVGSNANTHP